MSSEEDEKSPELSNHDPSAFMGSMGLLADKENSVFADFAALSKKSSEFERMRLVPVGTDAAASGPKNESPKLSRGFTGKTGVTVGVTPSWGGLGDGDGAANKGDCLGLGWIA